MKFETLALPIEAGIATLSFNRPKKANALSFVAWKELREALEAIDANRAARVVVLRGSGAHFTAGMDLELLSAVDGSSAHRREELRKWIIDIQDDVTAIERCRKPVIAAIHGYCLGGGVDIATACDLRYTCDDATFSVKEIDLAITADVGTIQRLPRLVGEGVARELIYTGRTFQGREAALMGLVNASYPSADALFSEVDKIARTIASKSPLALRGCKESILFTRDNPIATALNHVATWNAGMLDSDDFREAMAAFRDKRDPDFRD